MKYLAIIKLLAILQHMSTADSQNTESYKKQNTIKLMRNEK